MISKLESKLRVMKSQRDRARLSLRIALSMLDDIENGGFWTTRDLQDAIRKAKAGLT